LVLVCRINLPALGIDAFLLAKCDGFLSLTQIKDRNVSTGFGKGKTNALTDISGAPYSISRNVRRGKPMTQTTLPV
jgi:hypothetical protein